ncbi:MAG: hypothetical protein AAF317_03660, partial [Pseudomonadota bacterium]
MRVVAILTAAAFAVSSSLAPALAQEQSSDEPRTVSSQATDTGSLSTQPLATGDQVFKGFLAVSAGVALAGIIAAL